MVNSGCLESSALGPGLGYRFRIKLDTVGDASPGLIPIANSVLNWHAAALEVAVPDRVYGKGPSGNDFPADDTSAAERINR
jgi:hypothetical protein